MGLEPTISLHSAGSELALKRGRREKVAAERLLALLKSGKIAAGFRFPVRTLLWIPIPADYWASVGDEKFRVLRRSSENRRSGTFKVRAGDLADIVAVEVLKSAGKQNPTGFSEELKAVLSATKQSYDVEIIESDWEAYLKTLPNPASKRKSGRYEKEGWRDLCIIIGAYLLKHVEETSAPLKAADAAVAIHQIGKTEGITDLPGPATIKDVLSAIKNKQKTTSTK